MSRTILGWVVGWWDVLGWVKPRNDGSARSFEDRDAKSCEESPRLMTTRERLTKESVEGGVSVRENAQECRGIVTLRDFIAGWDWQIP